MQLHTAVMKYPKYPVIASADYHTYLFFSEGPKGKIAKGVIYSQLGGNLFDFTNIFPDARIFVEGSTLARTRLYQMGIADNLLEINDN